MFSIFKTQSKTKQNTENISLKEKLQPSPERTDAKASINSGLIISKASTFEPGFLSSFYQAPKEKLSIKQIAQKLKTQVSVKDAEIQRLKLELIEKNKIIESLIKTNTELKKQNNKHVSEIAELKGDLKTLKEDQMMNSIILSKVIAEDQYDDKNLWLSLQPVINGSKKPEGIKAHHAKGTKGEVDLEEEKHEKANRAGKDSKRITPALLIKEEPQKNKRLDEGAKSLKPIQTAQNKKLVTKLSEIRVTTDITPSVVENYQDSRKTESFCTTGKKIQIPSRKGLVQNLTKNIVSMTNIVVEELAVDDVLNPTRTISNITFVPLKKFKSGCTVESKKTAIAPERTETGSPCQLPQKKQVPKLFEGFFMVGVDKQDVLNFEKNHPDKNEGLLEPKFLFSYPGSKEDLPKEPRNSIPSYVFPFKVRVTKEKISSNNGLFEIVLAKNSCEYNSNCFVFPLLAGQIDTSQCQNSEIIRTANPTSMVYLICIKTTDYLELNMKEEQAKKDGKKRWQRKFWKVERVCCFMTFYPLIKFFMDLNVNILDMFKIERMKKFEAGGKDQFEIFRQIDARWVQEFMSVKLEAYLNRILNKAPRSFGESLIVPLEGNDSLNAYIPDQQNGFSMEASSISSLVFSFIPLSDLMFLLSIVLSEKKLVIMSENLNLLTSTLMTIYTLLKPFRYTYPLVFNLPELLLDFCDALGGILLGINQGLEYFQIRQLHRTYTDCFFVVLEEPKIYLFTDASNKLTVVEPYLGNLRQQVSEHYNHFNDCQTSKIDFGTTHKMAEARSANYANSCLVGDTPTIRRKVKPIPKANNFTVPRSDPRYCEKIMKTFYDSFLEHIVRHIPKEPIYKTDSKEKDLDYNAIAQVIIQKNPKDGDFLESFLKGQMFSYYLELHYDGEISC